MERSWVAQRGDNHIHRARVLKVRIRLPPANSRSLARFLLPLSKSRQLLRCVRARPGGTAGRDAQGSSTSRQLPVISLSGPFPVRDQALTTVAADGPANGRIAQRAPLRGDRDSRPARQIILKDLRQIIFKMTVHRSCDCRVFPHDNVLYHQPPGRLRPVGSRWMRPGGDEPGTSAIHALSAR
jgi:hypothetical protein